MSETPATEGVIRLKAWPKPILRADGTPKRAPAPESVAATEPGTTEPGTTEPEPAPPAEKPKGKGSRK